MKRLCQLHLLHMGRVNLIIVPCLFLSMIVLNSCSSVQYATSSNLKSPSVELYFNNLPVKQFDEIAYIEVSGSIFHSKQALVDKLAKKAKSLNGNAVIKIKYTYQFWWPNVEGVVIKFK